MTIKTMYQDKYNPLKTWEVCYMRGAMYLKQYIQGVQFGRGVRCTKAYIRSVGIFDFKEV